MIFGFECIEDKIARGINRRARKLLNAEKVVFSTNWEGHITDTRTCSSGNTVITFEAIQWSNKIRQRAQAFLYYDIGTEFAHSYAFQSHESQIDITSTLCFARSVRKKYPGRSDFQWSYIVGIAFNDSSECTPACI